MKANAGKNIVRKLNTIILLSGLVLTSCLNSASSSRRSTTSSSSTKTGSSSGSSSAVATTTTTDTSTTTTQKVELTNLVDPFTGTYKKKVTIPKNYKGYLYIGGLNLSALASHIIKVRFNFGIDNQTQTFTATLAHAPGITPSTDVQVLVIDMTTRPLQDMRLPYDLYDYTDYNSDSTLTPVTDPLDSGLYCRGLNLSDDPTYTATSDTSTCSATTDKCLYAYAKVADATYYKTSTGLTETPTKPQVWTSSTTWDSTLTYGMCLPDYGTNSLFTAASYLPTGYTYKGPYRPINQDAWAISSAALFGSSTTSSITTYNGLFETGSSSDKSTWYRSLLFPRSGTLSLNSGVLYLGSTSRIGSRGTLTADSTGTTKYVDGCNIRVQNYDSTSGETIGSCTVTGNIEVYYLSGTTEVSIATSNSLKLQLTRASTTNSEGVEVLSSAFKNCTSNTTCGTSECCYNKRCWSTDLVSQCVDTDSATGNFEIGTTCTSDLQCASLCCNNSTGVCAAHNPLATTPIYCGKTSGQTCVSKEFCAREYVPVCKLYKNGTNADGTVKCTVRCPTVATYGSCVGGYCVSPTGSTDTSSFDLTTCDGAIDP
jgi:hypothetical protein